MSLDIRKRAKHEEDDRYFQNPFIFPREPTESNQAPHTLAEDYALKVRERIEQQTTTFLKEIHKRKPPILGDDKDYSVYTGYAGLAYLNLRMSEFCPTDGGQVDHDDELDKLSVSEAYLKVALELMNREKGRHPHKRVITYLCGEPGPLAIATALCHKRGNNEKRVEFENELMSDEFKKIIFDTSFDSNEFLYGRIGYLYALMFVVKCVGSNSLITLEYIQSIVKVILDQGRSFAKKKGIQCPFMYQWHDKTYIGGAHGVSGIMHFMLQLDKYFGPNKILTDQDKEDIKKTIEFLITLKFSSGNYPSRVDGNRDELVQWCHGAPALCMLLCEAYEVYGDEKFLREAIESSEVIWKRGLLKKGYGLCHGMSGNGYVFLYLYKCTKNQDFLHKSLQFCEFMCGKEGMGTIDTPSDPMSLFNGLAGAICFFMDVAKTVNELSEGKALVYFPGYDLGY